MKVYSIFFIFLSIISLSYTFKCGHDKIKKPELKMIKENINSKTRKLSSRHNMKIYIDYEILESQLSSGNITRDYYNNIVNTLNLTTNYFSKLLEIEGTQEIQILSKYFRINNDYVILSEVQNIINKIIEADLILIPKIYDIGEGVDAAAYALAINLENYRPNIGVVLLGNHYDFNKTNSQSFLIMLLLHEITHVLGFSGNLYNYFQTNSKTITKEINGIKRTLFTGENVIKQAKRHFNCDNIEGIELENQGDNISAGSHWEARIMLGDYMISTDYPEIVISEISLALLEDTGWYYVNYYTGGLFRYGKGLGCDFLNNKCIHKGKTSFGREFCVNINEDRCSSGNIDRGICYIIPSNYFPYSYFNNPYKIGFSFADYCPVMFTPYSKDKYYFYSRCDSNGKNMYNFSPEYGETYGPNSICVLSSLKPQSSLSDSYKTARCHKVSCDTNTKSFILDIGEVNLTCSGNYEEIEVEGYSGSIICPDYNRVCTGSIWCNDPLSCIEKESLYNEDNTSVIKVYRYSTDLDEIEESEKEEEKKEEEIEEKKEGKEEEKEEEKKEEKKEEKEEEKNNSVNNDTQINFNINDSGIIKLTWKIIYLLAFLLL
jgi:hypothetical protein